MPPADITDGKTYGRRPDFYQSNVLQAGLRRSIPDPDSLVVHTTYDRPLVINGDLDVHGDLICINFFNV